LPARTRHRILIGGRTSRTNPVVAMALGGSDGGDGLLIGPILEWWDRHTAKRDARRTARAEARQKRREARATTSSDKPPA
jgi:hypothetical protein